jgi:hypothetical protein
MPWQHCSLLYCFGLGLRWEQDMFTARGNKWLLIILVIGLSFGVHFMALLTVPSIGFLFLQTL